MKLPNEFRINHRAASESLLRAVEAHSNLDEVMYELEKATYFENEAKLHAKTQRQEALVDGLLRAITRIRVAAEDDFPP